jgi:DNA-binding transcriptional LysR family regulator
MDLRRLRYLVAVADEGHITRAAERLGIQQPPLTRQIQLLEQELGAQLLYRHARGVSLTEAGAAVVADARGLIAAAERIGETARRAARGEQGRVAVGYTSSAAFHPFVFRQVNAFRRTWPGVQLALEEDSTVELMRALSEDRLDAAFIRTLGGNPAGLLVEPLVDEGMLAALPPEHRFSLREACDLAELAEETFVFYRRPAGQGLYDAIIAACHAAGFSPQIAQEAPRLPASLSLVAAGLGVSIVPASMRRMNMEGVSFLRLTGAPGLVAPLMLATRRGRRSPVIERFRQGVLAAVAEA